MTFNLLADMLCTCEMYPAVATEVLGWKCAGKRVRNGHLGGGTLAPARWSKWPSWWRHIGSSDYLGGGILGPQTHLLRMTGLLTRATRPIVAAFDRPSRYRRDLIEKELAFHAPDILCLQELQGATEGAGETARRKRRLLTWAPGTTLQLRPRVCFESPFRCCQKGRSRLW